MDAENGDFSAEPRLRAGSGSDVALILADRASNGAMLLDEARTVGGRRRPVRL
jgi:hypothetical protein